MDLPIQDEWDQRPIRGVGPHPYDPRLPEVAARVVGLIAAALPGTNPEHVGSTAVPGLPGKGIVDLQISVAQEQVPKVTSSLLLLGFRRQTGSKPFPPTRPMLTGSLRLDGVVYGIQCHILPDDSAEVGAMLAFRDRLRNDPAVFAEYAALKRRIVEGGTTDKMAYTEAKTGFIQTVLGSRG